LIITIFIVDDDYDLHQLYKKIFSMKGCNVVASAFDGAEAVKVYSELNPKPDVILMDHRMPVMNGVEAARELKRIDPSCKIIFLSADETAKESALAAGACKFKLKPVRLVELIDTIFTVVEAGLKSKPSEMNNESNRGSCSQGCRFA